jgi:Flp pilus assembly protein TadG
MVLNRRERRGEGDDGVVLVVIALAMVAILLFAAMVVDNGNARQVSRHAQASSDAAALAGARYLPLSAPDAAAAATATATAAQFAARNVLGTSATPTAATCDAGAPANASCYAVEGATITVATPYSGNHGLIYVSICQDTEATFGKVVGAVDSTVCRTAVARRYGGSSIGDAGVIALNDDGPCFDLRGSGGTELRVEGSVLANCADSPPNNLSGSNPLIDASAFYSVGTCDPSSECVGGSVSTPTIGMSGPVEDPLAGLPEPAATDTAFTHLSVSQYNALTCLDGLYRVHDVGNIQVKSTCTGATAFTFLVQAGVGGPPNLKDPYEQFAPTSGTYAGISMFLARDNDSVIEWNGNAKSSATYHGTVYAPAATVEWGGNIDILIEGGQVIAHDYVLKGGGGDKNLGFYVVPPAEVPPVPTDDDIGLEL